MKKYLMTGIAALALCAGFTSCSHDLEPMSQDEINQMEAQKITQNYEKAFMATFGKPASNKDWGFGVASTRTRGVYANANQWAAPYSPEISEQTGFEVPDPLKPGQKERVYRYFQTHPYLTYQDPEWDNYFVQQVYKGGEDVLETTDGLGAVLSTEQYSQATSGSTSFTGSGNMDYLTFGSKDNSTTYFDHCNNFNGADGGWVPVLDEGEPLNGGNTHQDQIMLMYQSKTDCVGFHDSRSSTYHFKGHCALVSYEVIDAWADSVKRETGITIGLPVTDKWERSFVGLDYESSPVANAYAKNSDGDVIYAKIKDFATTSVDYIYLGQEEDENGELKDVFVKWDEYNGKDNILTYSNGNPVPCLYINGSQILGTVEGGGRNTYTHDMSVLEYDAQNKQWNTQNRKCLDLPMIMELVNRNGLPNLNDEMKFIINPGGRDYVFSDWIVTLSKAQKQDNEEEEEEEEEEEDDTPANLRVIAEDLTVDNGSPSDFDFNDVVFDVYYGDASTAKVTILAAGGTLELKVNGVEVHQLLGHPGKMINTNGTKSSSASVRTLSVDDVPTQDILLGFAVNDARDAKDIQILVNKKSNGVDNWVPLTAERGKAASKVAVDPHYTWNDERVPMPDSFKQYVQAEDDTYDDWWKTKEQNQ